jgi:hypothetical protein
MIYFIGSRVVDAVKIGFTSRPAVWRLTSFQIGSPVVLEIIKLIDGDKDRESVLHIRWSNARLHGEWFKLSAIANDLEDLPACSDVELPRCRLCTQVLNIKHKPHAKHQKTCHACASRQRTKRNHSVIVCATCGATFATLRPKARFCSQTCQRSMQLAVVSRKMMGNQNAVRTGVVRARREQQLLRASVGICLCCRKRPITAGLKCSICA